MILPRRFSIWHVNHNLGTNLHMLDTDDTLRASRKLKMFLDKLERNDAECYLLIDAFSKTTIQMKYDRPVSISDIPPFARQRHHTADSFYGDGVQLVMRVGEDTRAMVLGVFATVDAASRMQSCVMRYLRPDVEEMVSVHCRFVNMPQQMVGKAYNG